VNINQTEKHVELCLIMYVVAVDTKKTREMFAHRNNLLCRYIFTASYTQQCCNRIIIITTHHKHNIIIITSMQRTIIHVILYASGIQIFNLFLFAMSDSISKKKMKVL